MRISCFGCAISLIAMLQGTGLAATLRRLEVTTTLTHLRGGAASPSSILAYRSVATDGQGLTYVLLDDASKQFLGPATIGTQIYVEDRDDPEFRVELTTADNGCMNGEVLFYTIGKEMVAALSQGIFENGHNSNSSSKRQHIRLFEPVRNVQESVSDASEPLISYQKIYAKTTRPFLCTKDDVDHAIDMAVRAYYASGPAEK